MTSCVLAFESELFVQLKVVKPAQFHNGGDALVALYKVSFSKCERVCMRLCPTSPGSVWEMSERNK